MLRELRQSRVCDASIKLQVLQLRNTDRNALFVEGPTDKEYLAAELRRISPRLPLHFIVCGGKEQVYRQFEIYGHLERTLFMVDKDWDDLIPVSRPVSRKIYRTPFYSIENHLYCRAALEAFLADMLHIDEHDSRWGEILTEYDCLHAMFSRRLKGYVALAICARRHGIDVLLNDANFARLFEFRKLRLRSIPGLSRKLLETFGTGVHGITFSEFRDEYRRLGSMDSKKWLRGKWEAWLFTAYIRAVLSSLSGQNNSLGTPVRCYIQVTERSAITIFAARTEAPEDLYEFVRSRAA